MNVQEWLGKDNKIGIDIWEKKYRYNNETFDEWLERITTGVDAYKEVILNKEFLPAGRILSNRGLYKDNKKVTYSNCYVLPAPEDSIESIFDCASKMARTFSYGGGVGIDISKLAPRGAAVNNTAKQTSGAVSFMDLYSLVTGLIGQNGRRGALMISRDCDHPDIEEFIEIKSDLDKVTKANISIKVTDKFMAAVVADEDFKLSFTRQETGEVIEKTIKARELFWKMCQMNYDYAEPGILFWDTINKFNLLNNNDEFHYGGTNPCAEEPLPDGGSCLLGSLNLAAFVKDGKFNYDACRNAVITGVSYLNDVLDEGLSLHPLEIQRKTVRDWRQIGLGIMGLADMLIKLGIKYGSKESIEFCDELGKFIALNAIKTSAALADLHETPYPKYDNRVLESAFFQENADTQAAEWVEETGLYNSQLLTCAPTGTLSTMLGISGGIEPIFANSYTRKTESLHGHDEYYKIYTPIVQEYMKKHNLNSEEELPEYFITAEQLKPEERIEMQSVWQKHIDASISSTINLPNDATVEDIFNIYIMAWTKNLKGVTIYRAGCKREGILVEKPETISQPSTNETIKVLPRGYIKPANDNVIGFKRKLMTGCGSLHFTAFFDVDDGELVEVYLSKGSTGGCNNFMIGLSRMISMSARAGVPVSEIVDQLMSTGVCGSYASRRAVKHDTSKGSCCPMAIGYALKEMWEEFQGKELKPKEITPVVQIKNESVEIKKPALCPQCGEPLIFEGGCNICKSCGWSKCD